MALHVEKDGWIKAIRPEDLPEYKKNGWKENMKKTFSVPFSKKGKKPIEEEKEVRNEE